MNNKKLHNKNDVYLAQWMEGELSDDELRDRVSEEDFSMYRKMKNGMCVLEELQQPLTSSFEAIQKKIELRKSIKRRRKVIGWGMSIAASLIIIFGLYTMFNPLTTKIETSFAEQRTISLLDGSEVIINTRSEISYDEKDWSENRMISLNGEAFFKVEKGSTFTVNTSLGSVTVLGTEFNVNSNDDYFEVVCYEGKVKVMNNKEEFILIPNTAFRRINGNLIEKWRSDNDQPTWILGESSFKSVPVKYVIGALERQYEIQFKTNGIDENMIFTGSFTHNDLQIALASVFKTLNIHYDILEKNVIVLKQS